MHNLTNLHKNFFFFVFVFCTVINQKSAKQRDGHETDEFKVRPHIMFLAAKSHYRLKYPHSQSHQAEEQPTPILEMAKRVLLAYLSDLQTYGWYTNQHVINLCLLFAWVFRADHYVATPTPDMSLNLIAISEVAKLILARETPKFDHSSVGT